ncbi:hypothetical protein VE03_07367 [Pseudogymnoascus sp. 23342-1-I1]|nr:hypothetical protein VE03_07367 [Pseudogymnoascus sp. 23342-1-I1]
MGRWLKEIDVVGKISGVLAVPINSALLAQAAQLFTLADRAWADVILLYKALRHPTAIQPPIQSLLIQIEPATIITCNDAPIIVLNNSPSCDTTGISNKVVGYDPEPSDLETCPQDLVIQRLANKISDVTSFDIQTNLWPERTPGSGAADDTYPVQYPITQTFFWYDEELSTINKNNTFYTASIPNGTKTGVLREHALRQQSTTNCVMVSQSSFPSTCGGEKPLRTAFSNRDVNVDICCPGSYDKVPWTLSSSRQDITEEIWIDVAVFGDSKLDLFHRGIGKNFTLHCMSNSTRGYFELGNYQNGFAASGILETWPGPEDMAANFNDHKGSIDYYDIPSNMDTPRDQKTHAGHISWPNVPGFRKSSDELGERLPTPGPLMTTALALFGNSSAFFIAKNATDLTTGNNYNRICQDTVRPFSLYSGLSPFDTPDEICSKDRTNPQYYDLENRIDEKLLPQLVYNFAYIFSNADNANKLLRAGLFFASEVHLTTTASLGRTFNSRAIYTSDGSQILKPQYSLAGVIVVSVLIAIQVAGLIILAIYNSSFPTWTPSLDALALAKMGTELKHLDLSPIGRKARGDAVKLVGARGLVGVVEDDKEMVVLPERPLSRDGGNVQIAPENTHGDIEAQNIGLQRQLRLGLGSTGLISKGLVAKAANGNMNRRKRSR